eukprot:545657-Prymnesium_polylepis.1
MELLAPCQSGEPAPTAGASARRPRLACVGANMAPRPAERGRLEALHEQPVAKREHLARRRVAKDTPMARHHLGDLELGTDDQLVLHQQVVGEVIVGGGDPTPEARSLPSQFVAHVAKGAVQLRLGSPCGALRVPEAVPSAHNLGGERVNLEAAALQLLSGAL